MTTEPKWIKHDGSEECPVPAGHDVEVRFRNCVTHRGIAAGRRAWFWDMAHDDIIAYRDWTAHKQQQAEPMARDMTLRDWYAGQALKGLLAGNPEGYEGWEVASDAEGYARDMMNERAKRMEGEQ